MLLSIDFVGCVNINKRSWLDHPPVAYSYSSHHRSTGTTTPRARHQRHQPHRCRLLMMGPLLPHTTVTTVGGGRQRTPQEVPSHI